MKIRPLLLLVSALLLPMAAAYIEWGTVGLPALPPNAAPPSVTMAGAYGFPAWLRLTHYVNLLFLILLIRSGL